MIRIGTTVAPLLFWVVGAALSAIFLFGLLLVAAPFLEGFVWGTILVLMTWPIYRWLHIKCQLGETVAAFLMTTGIGAILVITAVPVVTELGRELYSISKEFSLGASQTFSSPIVDGAMQRLHFDEAYTATIKALGDMSLRVAGKATNALLASLFNIGIMIFSSYFFYRHGSQLVRELQDVMDRYSALNWQRVFALTGDTIKGVVYGALATALAQGILAGIGYHVAGVSVPALLGLVTTLMSFVPFGAPIVYVPVSLYLILSVGDWSAGIGLLIWGVIVVSTIDNILRPLFISHAMKLPLLLVFVGVLGGIFRFGLVGLFIGPVLVALAHAAWKEIVDSLTMTAIDRNNAIVNQIQENC